MRPDTDSLGKKVSSAEMNKMRQKKKMMFFLRTNGFTSAPVLGRWLKLSLPTTIVFLNELIASGYVKILGSGNRAVVASLACTVCRKMLFM